MNWWQLVIQSLDSRLFFGAVVRSR